MLREYLGEACYEMVEAVDGQEALEKSAVDPEIRFVITELKMPRKWMGLSSSPKSEKNNFTISIFWSRRTAMMKRPWKKPSPGDAVLGLQAVAESSCCFREGSDLKVEREVTKPE